MLRSIVARSQPLLSHLRWSATALGVTNPSRAYASSSPPSARCKGSDDGTMAAAAAAADRHLYVVLQESAMNRFSIYKLPDMHDVTADEAPRPLPRAALDIGFTLVGTGPHFEAVGRKIVVTGDADTISEDKTICQFITFLYDTKTRTLDGGRPLPDPDDKVWIKPGYHAAAPVGDKLCVLEGEGNKPFYLYEEPQEVNHYLDEWVWEQGRSPLPLHATGHGKHVESHVVHPDGRTIFASSSFTFSLDTETGDSARRGDWRLPFQGRGFYDGYLDAWVGIRVADGTEGGTVKGHRYLCACDIPAVLADGTALPEPAWKVCKEELTFVQAPARARNAMLVHADRGMFCLVELTDGGEARVTSFFAKRAHNGDLEVTPGLPGRSYLVPNYSRGLHTAFWI